MREVNIQWSYPETVLCCVFVQASLALVNRILDFSTCFRRKGSSIQNESAALHSRKEILLQRFRVQMTRLEAPLRCLEA